jgi:hypothetical protein
MTLLPFLVAIRFIYVLQFCNIPLLFIYHTVCGKLCVFVVQNIYYIEL